jgi:hypothetical protein
MKSLNSFLRDIPFYPLLLCVYPVLFLWDANFVQVPPYAVERSLLTSIGAGAVICLVCLAAARNLPKAALLAGMAMLFFFFYGQLFSLVDNHTLFGFNYGRHRFILPLLSILFLVGAILILRAKSDLRNLTLTFNLVGSFLVGLSLVQLGDLMVNNPTVIASKPALQLPAEVNASTQAVPTNTPDVYYFLLDGYDRQDLMASDIHLDNQKFISDLENLGFVIPDCTQSNYTTTVTSMAATLNMDYIETLGVPDSDVATMSFNGYTRLLRPFTLDNQVMREFRKFGYKIVTLKSAFPFIDYKNSDVIIDYQSTASPLNRLEAYDFEYVFLRTTLMRVLIEETEYDPDKFRNIPDSLMVFINPNFNRGNGYIKQVFLQNLYNLDQLDTVSNLPGKKFIYAHLLVTHPPFTFTTTGDLRSNNDDTKEGYAQQITYVNQRMLTIIKNILAGSKTPPVIILQGDHGHAVNQLKSEETFRILNAYYLPQGGSSKIYPTITPVNSFRLIFSDYFNQNYPLLPDQSIWINPSFPDSHQIAPQSCVH